MTHECRLVNLKMIWDRLWDYGFRASLGVYRCQDCGQLWKIRFQYDPGTGSDNIWLKPGEKERRYEFTHEEAAEFGETEVTV